MSVFAKIWWFAPWVVGHWPTFLLLLIYSFQFSSAFRWLSVCRPCQASHATSVTNTLVVLIIVMISDGSCGTVLTGSVWFQGLVRLLSAKMKYCNVVQVHCWCCCDIIQCSSLSISPAVRSRESLLNRRSSNKETSGYATWFTTGGAIRIAHYDVIDDVITRKL